jgi:hypothetical protein
MYGELIIDLTIGVVMARIWISTWNTDDDKELFLFYHDLGNGAGNYVSSSARVSPNHKRRLGPLSWEVERRINQHYTCHWIAPSALPDSDYINCRLIDYILMTLSVSGL